jgi:hypothetical protein
MKGGQYAITMWTPVIAAVIMTCVSAGRAGCSERSEDTPLWNNAVLAGQPVEISPWTYSWRADRAVQPDPEAYFIPRRLERLDKVYRTAFDALPGDELKSLYYDQKDILRRLPPKPKGHLQAGLLWTGGLVDYRIELQWPAGAAIPSPENVEVRVYPTAFGWFGWTVDKILTDPVISSDRRTWTYKSDPTELMDTAYSAHIPAATEMVAVFCEGDAPVPGIRITGPSLSAWKRMDVEIEWGFRTGAAERDFDGRLEPYVALVGPIAPLPGDEGTTVGDKSAWRSRSTGDGRRGIVVPLLYAPSIGPGLESRLTVRTGSGGFTFSIRDLEKGPILIPEQGVFVSKAGSGETARGFTRELEAKGLKSIRQMTREHGEAASWDEVMREVRLWTCPDGTPVPHFPEVPDPVMKVQLSDERWTEAWRAASNQLQGRHLWPALGHEIGRVARDMELVGLHAEVMPVYDYFLASPGVKSDGDLTDGKGSLEWAKSMRHDMGYSHEGTHPSTGRLLFSMCERYFLTGDREWFLKHRARLQAAADWIIGERKRYMKGTPNRDRLFVAGLMPPCMLGDYALPASDWHWYYGDNALSLQGLQRFADVLAEIDPAAGRKYQREAAAFRKALRRALVEEAALAPVRLGRDGMYRSYIPRMAYAGGRTGPEVGAPQFPEADLFWGSLGAAEPFAAIDANDFRIVDTLDTMEEMGTYADDGINAGPFTKPLREDEEARAKKGLSKSDSWFWRTYSFLPKISFNSNIYLLQDDVPGFLRFWMNSYAGMTGANGKLWEHSHLGSYADCDTPDTMTAGWFVENFRNLLVMEEGPSLWLARATPRSWLEQGRRISVANAPTYFGTLAYEIVSDTDHGSITATIELPVRRPVRSLFLRLRHPRAAAIKSVTVNGRRSRAFDPSREVIKLTGLTGKVVVEARY